MEPVAVRYTSADFRALAWHCRDCRRRLIFFLFLPLLVILIEELIFSTNTTLDPLVIAGSLILGALISLAFLVFVPPLRVRAQRKAGFIEPYQFTLNDEGVHVAHPRQDNLFRWAGVHSIANSGERLFVYTTPSCALILPRRCFKSPFEFDRWYSEAQRRWSEANA